MKPLFPFYGSKWRSARRYPPPHNGVVVEPFAGSAGYSIYYAPRKVFLIDADPIIVSVWKYLIGATPRDILSLPDLDVGQSVDSLAIAQEAKWLIGFWLNRGSAQPKKTKTAFSARTERSQLTWGARARERIAADVEGVRHWEIIHGNFDDAPPIEATWFLDPPYIDKGRYYRYRKLDYAALGEWCLHLTGQVIVCEQHGATWLPFKPLAVVKSTKGASSEVVFTRRLP